MELWIRSQDKETLILAQHLDIYNVDKEIYSIEESGNDIGTYKTRARAMEVLNDINEILNHKCMFDIDKKSWQTVFATYSSEKQNRILTNMSVYQMPEK